MTLTNNGNTTLHLLNSAASTDFVQTNNCATLLPGVSCSYAISFHPTNSSTAAIRTGTLEITSDASTALEFVSLFGTTNASPLTFNPAALDFGTLNVGSSSTLGVTVNNTSSVPVTFTGLAASGDYSVTSGTCPAVGSSLAAGASCVLQITFSPIAAGTRTGTLSVSSDATTLPLTVPLTGVAVAARLQIVPGALLFGTVVVGSPASLSLTLLNAGSAPVTGISGQISGANFADFVITTQCSTPTLTPNQGCTMTVMFTPSADGLRTANLTVVSSDPSSPAIIPLTGTGGDAAAAGFTLTVNGGPSASVTVQAGSPATYSLVITPINGFTGNVALTCAPITPGMYAACSLNPSTVTLNGSPQNSTVTINTITKASLELHEHATVFLALLGLPLLLFKRARRIERVLILLIFGVLATGSLVGCGGNGSGNGNGGLLYTPAGGYQYSITATSTSGPQITQTVTLNLNVQ